MLRPATPLSVLLFAAFALLLLSVLSTPIIKGIPLGSFEDVSFGVFGFCKPDGCSGIEIGYDTTSLLPDQPQAFDLPSSARNSLSTILVVHPVAAFLTLAMFVMAVAAHVHSAAHSARYLLILFIVGLLDFLMCLLAFLVDVLLFTPHIKWGSYIVLAATILVGLSGLVSCAMRRTLVGRKARQKRIAENAEMSGENYFNREAQAKAAAAARQPTMPMVSGGSGPGDALPTFASYESQKEDQISDEHIPLTSRSPSDRSPNNIPADMAGSGDAAMYNGQRRSASAPPQQDPYGAPVAGAPDGYGVRRGPSFDRINSRGRGGMSQGSVRGRGGGYGTPPRGGYSGYGPPNNRGGYGPPQGRGGYGPPGGRGGYGPPRGGYGSAAGQRGGRSPTGYNGAGSYDQRPSPGYDPYGRQVSDGGYSLSPNASMPSVTTGSYDAYNPDRNSLPRAESPPPLPSSTGAPLQAVEMDANPDPKAAAPYGGPLRDSDADVAGMVGLQQARSSGQERHNSDGSKYSNEESQYVPPRTYWNQAGRSSPSVPAPLNINRPTELPGRNSPAEAPGGNAYYEDVDPRFAAEATARRGQPTLAPPSQGDNTYEDIHAAGGARSPADSDRSNFTSISQRGVNPRWNPPPPMPYQGQTPRRPVQQRQDVLLNSNPDFQLANRASPGPRNGGMVPGSAYPNGAL